MRKIFQIMFLFLSHGKGDIVLLSYYLDSAGKGEACPDNCLGDWKAFGDHIYLWQDSAKSWNDAEAICACCNGRLTSVADQQVQDFLTSEMVEPGSSIWIGASDQDAEGHWVWKDGKPLIFNNW